MEALRYPYSTTYTYTAQDATVAISSESGNLSAEIKTKRLSFESIKSPNKELPENYRFYTQIANMYSKQAVMAKVAGGAIGKEDVTKKVKRWSDRWFNNDPYSGFAIHEEYGNFVGIAVVGHGDEHYQTEIVCILDDSKWNQGYGKETAIALNAYVTALVDAGFQYDPKTVVREVILTARVDNPYSCKIAEKNMGNAFKTQGKFGDPRNFYKKEIPTRDPAYLRREIVSFV